MNEAEKNTVIATILSCKNTACIRELEDIESLIKVKKAQLIKDSPKWWTKKEVVKEDKNKIGGVFS